MMKSILPRLARVTAILLAAPLFGQEIDPSFLLHIGDPRFKDLTVEVKAGEIVSLETGAPVSFETMIEEMRAVPFVFLGETHDSLPMQELQARILRALSDRDPALAVGLEMYPVAFQEPLSRWSAGLLDEDAFLREGRWYTTWNQNFAYYRPIFALIKERRLPLYALNAPREIITRIRRAGWDALSDEEKAIVPKPDLANEEHRRLMRTIFSSEEMPEAMKGAGMEMMFEGLYRGQAAWDSVMAANAVKARGGGERKVVVLVGSGHLLFNLGLNRRTVEMSGLPGKTVVAVEIPRGKSSLTVSRTLADYIVGLEAEERRAYPSIGLAFKKFAGLDNPVIERTPIDGAARGRDFEKGDVVLSVDGRKFTDIDEMRILLAGFGWGDEVRFRLLRAGTEKDVVLKMEETLPAPGK